MKKTEKKRDIICRCNNVSRETIETSIKDGCRTMNEIFDATQAGVGPCGGSCRRVIVPILKSYLKSEESKDKLEELNKSESSKKVTSSGNSDGGTEPIG